MMLHPHWLKKKSARRRRKKTPRPSPIIEAFTREMMDRAAPAFEALIRDAMRDGKKPSLDFRFGEDGKITIPPRPE